MFGTAVTVVRAAARRSVRTAVQAVTRAIGRQMGRPRPRGAHGGSNVGVPAGGVISGVAKASSPRTSSRSRARPSHATHHRRCASSSSRSAASRSSSAAPAASSPEGSVVHRVSPSASSSCSESEVPSASRSLRRAVRMRVLAVPSGIPSRSATSIWVRPAEEREFEGSPLGVASGCPTASRTLSRRRLSQASRSTSSSATSNSRSTSAVRLRTFASRRTRSIALWRARLNSQGPTAPRDAIEPRGVLPDRDEDLLDDVLREALGAGDPIGQGVERPAVPLVQRLDGASRPGRRCGPGGRPPRLGVHPSRSGPDPMARRYRAARSPPPGAAPGRPCGRRPRHAARPDDTRVEGEFQGQRQTRAGRAYPSPVVRPGPGVGLGGSQSVRQRGGHGCLDRQEAAIFADDRPSSPSGTSGRGRTRGRLRRRNSIPRPASSACSGDKHVGRRDIEIGGGADVEHQRQRGRRSRARSAP